MNYNLKYFSVVFSFNFPIKINDLLTLNKSVGNNDLKVVLSFKLEEDSILNGCYSQTSFALAPEGR